MSFFNLSAPFTNGFYFPAFQHKTGFIFFFNVVIEKGFSVNDIGHDKKSSKYFVKQAFILAEERFESETASADIA